MLPALPAKTLITSLREFTRDSDLREKALRQKQPVIVQNKRQDDFFVLLPASSYEKLYALYEDFRDTATLQKAMKTKTTWQDWTAVKKAIAKK